jgi:hypothetical protein
MFWAIFLIVIGVAFLLKNLGVLPGGAWDVIWPSLLIAWGLSIIFTRSRAWGWWCPPLGGPPRWRDKKEE